MMQPVMVFTYFIFGSLHTLLLNEKLPLLFIFLCLEMFLNWYCVYRISWKSTPIQLNSNWQPASVQSVRRDTTYKCWYCTKCRLYMCKPVQHCLYCQKCYHFRDNHCFMLGLCILRQNMGNLILFCFYASLVSLYSAYVIGYWLYEYIDNIRNNSPDHNLFENFCFPVAVKLLSKNLLCTLSFVALIAHVYVTFFCMYFATRKLFNCLNGKQRYAHLTGKQNLKDIFGSCGLVNIIIPCNSLLAKRNINDCRYQMKEV